MSNKQTKSFEDCKDFILNLRELTFEYDDEFPIKELFNNGDSHEAIMDISVLVHRFTD